MDALMHGARPQEREEHHLGGGGGGQSGVGPPVWVPVSLRATARAAAPRVILRHPFIASRQPRTTHQRVERYEAV